MNLTSSERCVISSIRSFQTVAFVRLLLLLATDATKCKEAGRRLLDCGLYANSTMGGPRYAKWGRAIRWNPALHGRLG